MLRPTLSLLCTAFILLSLVCSSHAVPPFPGVSRPEGETCFVNGEAVQNNISRSLKYAPGFAPPISATTRQILVIRVDFSDKPMSLTLDNATTFFNRVSEFYLENSYGLYSTVFTISVCASSATCGSNGAYRMPEILSFYGTDNATFGIGGRDDILVSSAIAEADQNYTFSIYSEYMIYHAGDGQETSGLSSDIWSVYINASNFGLTSFANANGATLVTNLTIVPESETSGVSPLGVICHEYGHQLGLPDLYLDSFTSAVGNWSVMDSGIYIGSPLGSNPSHLDAWSKQYLGFSSPETVTFTTGETKTLSPAESSRSSFIRLPISVSDVGGDSEYFLLEYRKTSGASFDTALPGEGLLIWHVDDSIASNATRLANNNINAVSSRRGVDLVESDSSDPSTNGGDSTDPWKGTVDFKTTKSDAYNGTESGIKITNISGAGNATMSMSLTSTFSNPTLAAKADAEGVAISGGPLGYANPDKGERTLIGVTPKAGGTVNLKIYTLTGDLVWEDSFSGTADVNVSRPWDGKNADGTIAASGVYLVHVEGGGLNVTKRIAIAR